MGPVRHLVAPSLLHHRFLAAAKARYPAAQVHAPPGLRAKLPALPCDAELADGAPAAWGGVLEVHLLSGAPRMGEALGLHRPSRTLLCADLVFNVRSWRGAGTGFVLWLAGTRGRLAASRGLHVFVRDRAAFSQSLRLLQSWDFRRILMGHGEVYESATARADLFAALEQRLGAGLRAPPAR